jgi:hypothetical protein
MLMCATSPSDEGLREKAHCLPACGQKLAMKQLFSAAVDTNCGSTSL